MKQQKKFQKKGSSQQRIIQKKKTETVELKKKKLWIWLAVISIITSAAYFQTFDNEITNWDDDNYIVKNPWLQELSGENLKSIFSEYYMGNYHPLAMLSLSIDFQIGGVDEEGEIIPKIYIISNFLFHLFNTLLVFWLAWLLIEKFEVAVLTAILFGIATLHVESVAWISERKDVLYAFFFIASLISYVKYVKDRKVKYYAISLLLFILSLFSKGQAVSLAVTIFIIDYFYKRKLLETKVILEKLPFLVLAAIFGFIAIKAQQAGNALHDSDSYEFYKRIGFAGYAFTQYIIKLIAPNNLAAIYPYPDIINRSIPAYYWLFMLPSIGVAWAFFYYLKRNRTIAFCIGFFIINIALLLQLIPVGSAILADRYSYIPSIGFHLLSAILIYKLIEKNKSKEVFIYGVTGIYIVVIGGITFFRCDVWQDSMTLWNDTIEKSPKAVVAWNNRGSMKDKDKNHEAAIEDFTRAIVLKPDYTHAFYNRGTSKKDWAKERNDSLMMRSAIKDFDQAIEFNTEFVEAFHNRGMTYENLSDFAKSREQQLQLLNTALQDYNKTIEINPTYENALVNRGVIFGKMNMLDKAIGDFNRAIELTPDNTSAYSNRGLAKDKMENHIGALEDYSKAIEMDPEFTTAYLNRGITLRKLQKYEESINDFTTVISLDQEQAAAYYFRGMNFLSLNKRTEACNDLSIGAKLNHQYAAFEYQRSCLNASGKK